MNERDPKAGTGPMLSSLSPRPDIRALSPDDEPRSPSEVLDRVGQSNGHMPPDLESVGLGRTKSLQLLVAPECAPSGRTRTQAFEVACNVHEVLQRALVALGGREDIAPLDIIHQVNVELLALNLPEETSQYIRSLIVLCLETLEREALLRRALRENQDLLLKLKIEATFDTLTGLWNQNTAKKYFPRIFRHCRRNNIPLFCAMLDLDNFHSLNETFEHAGGDEVLKDLAAFLRSMGGNVVIARYGQGEEFCLLFVGHNEEDVIRMLEALRENVEQSMVAYGDQGIRYTLSGGVFDADLNRIPSFDILAHHADKALFEAKRSQKKNCITCGRFDEQGVVNYRRASPENRISAPGVPRGKGRKEPVMSPWTYIKSWLANKFPRPAKALLAFVDKREKEAA